MAIKIGCFLLLSFELSMVANRCHAQSNGLDPKQWAAKLSRNDNSGNIDAQRLDSTLEHVDSARAFQFLEQLKEKGSSAGDHFRARFNCVKAQQILFQYSSYQAKPHDYTRNINVVKGPVANLFYSALDIAYGTEDDYLAAFVSYAYAMTIIQFGDIGVAIMYARNSAELYDHLSYDISPNLYQFLAELLFSVGEYKDCIGYGKKAITAWQRSPQNDKFLPMTCMNTVGLAYQRQQVYDSAMLFYDQALNMAEKENVPVWVGIVSGNMAQVCYAQRQYDAAYPLFLKDYKTSRDSGVYDNAGNSLQWASRTSLALGKHQRALDELRESFQLLKRSPDAKYLRNAYFTAMELFKDAGDYDSALCYSNLYATLNDSLEKVQAGNSLAISRARLSDMASQYTNEKLNRDRTATRALRNTIITSILLLSLFIILLVNRAKAKAKSEKTKADREKRLLEQEIASARNQLHVVVNDVSEKAGLVEKLERRLRENEQTAEHQSIISELSRLTISTETDWDEFKSLFETIHPGFFLKLTNKFPGITAAEQRMAALTRLHLPSRQIASTLGISVDSVHKSRQRLRQRFKIGTEANLDEIVSSL